MRRNLPFGLAKEFDGFRFRNWGTLLPFAAHIAHGDSICKKVERRRHPPQIGFPRTLSDVSAFALPTPPPDLAWLSIFVGLWEVAKWVYCEYLSVFGADVWFETTIPLREAQIPMEQWTKIYNTKRPHSVLAYRPPAPETIVPIDTRPIMHQHSNWTT